MPKIRFLFPRILLHMDSADLQRFTKRPPVRVTKIFKLSIISFFRFRLASTSQQCFLLKAIVVTVRGNVQIKKLARYRSLP